MNLSDPIGIAPQLIPTSSPLQPGTDVDATPMPRFGKRASIAAFKPAASDAFVNSSSKASR